MATAIRVGVIGAGSAVFSLGLVKDLILTPSLAGSEVVFMDINAERLRAVAGLARRYNDEMGANLRFVETLNREEALTDADFVINTAFAKGHHHARRLRDLTAEHGYYYGGVDLGGFYDLQLQMSVARDMERICPDAWLIQSGNPVYEGCTLMNRETGLKIIGLCHGHYGYLEICKTLGLDPARVTFQAPGLNHEIWMTHFLYDGKDAYPLIDEWIATKGEEYWRTHVADRTHDTQMSRGTIQQYQMYGLMPIGDTPRSSINWWQHTDIETKKRYFGEPWGGPDTELARPFYVANQEKKMAEAARVATDPQSKVSDFIGTDKTREQQVPIIDALVNNNGAFFQVNIPNRGGLPGVADDVVAELPAWIDARGVQPLRVAPLPPKIMLTHILPRVLEMERELLAYKTGDRTILLYSVLMGSKTRSFDQAAAVLDDLMTMEGHEELAAHYTGNEVVGEAEAQAAWAGQAAPEAAHAKVGAAD